MFDLNSPMPPIWIMYPHISQYSIGWRMGYGEGYKYDLLKTLSEEDQNTYKKMFPQPIFWQDLSYLDNLEEDEFIEEEDDENVFWINKLMIQYWFKEKEYNHFEKINLSKDINQELVESSLLDDNNVGDRSCLKQDYTSLFSIDIDDFFCLEQYIISQKALLFDDEEIYKLILKSNTLEEIRDLEKKIANVDSDIWDKYKYTIMLTGNYYKFSQNKEMRDILFSTRSALLMNVENLNIVQKKGSTILDFALVTVKEELKRVYKNFDLIDWSKLKEYSLE